MIVFPLSSLFPQTKTGYWEEKLRDPLLKLIWKLVNINCGEKYIMYLNSYLHFSSGAFIASLLLCSNGQCLCEISFFVPEPSLNAEDTPSPKRQKMDHGTFQEESLHQPMTKIAPVLSNEHFLRFLVGSKLEEAAVMARHLSSINLNFTVVRFSPSLLVCSVSLSPVLATKENLWLVCFYSNPQLHLYFRVSCGPSVIFWKLN